MALTYLQQSLSIRQQIGDKQGEGATLHNIGVNYFEQSQEFDKALPLLWQAYFILKKLGSPNADVTAGYLNTIRQQIGEERYNQIIQSLPQTPEL